MEYTIEHDKKNGVCVIRVFGSHKRPQDSQELLKIAGAFAGKHECSRFLFDMREVTVVGSTLDAYNTVIGHEEFGIRKSFRIAAVYPTVTEDNKFMENVGVNRGAVAFQVFDDIDAAHEWIIAR
jgi:hypothetical protein